MIRALLILSSLLLASCGEQPVPVVVLYSQATPHIKPALPIGSYREFPLESFRNPGLRADTVIVAGHSIPPDDYASHDPQTVAAATASFQPSLVVLDTCYGASTPILDALAQRLDAWVVAPPFLIPIQGMRYDDGLFAVTDPARRARMVQTDPPSPILRWRLDREQLAETRQQVERMTAAELRSRLKLAVPALVRVDLPDGPKDNGQVLVPVPAERFK